VRGLSGQDDWDRIGQKKKLLQIIRSNYEIPEHRKTSKTGRGERYLNNMVWDYFNVVQSDIRLSNRISDTEV
jgi:hypothetical protein